MKKQFKDMKIGEHFFAWGDFNLNYDFPKECLMEKMDKNTAREILKSDERGISSLFNGKDVFVVESENDLERRMKCKVVKRSKNTD